MQSTWCVAGFLGIYKCCLPLVSVPFLLSEMFSSNPVHWAGSQHSAAYQVSTPPDAYQREGCHSPCYSKKAPRCCFPAAEIGHLIQPLAGYLNPHCSIPPKGRSAYLSNLEVAGRELTTHPYFIRELAAGSGPCKMTSGDTGGSSTGVCSWTHWVCVLALPLSNSVTLNTGLAQLCSTSSL